MASEADTASATFRIALEDATSGPAAASAAGLQALRDKIDGDIGALRGLQQALRNLKGGGVAADSTIAGLKDRIAGQKATIAGAQAGYLKLGGALDGIRKKGPAGDGGLGGLAKAMREIDVAQKSQAAAKRTKAIAEASQLAGGRVASLGGSLSKLGSIMSAGTAVSIALGAAILAVAAATLLATKHLIEYGIATANARRNELLRLEGLAKIRNYWSGFSATTANAAKTAGFLQSQIDAVSGSVAIGRDQVAGYAEQLWKMGLRGGNLQAALQGVATTAAVQGEAQAQAFASWAAGANLTGQSVKRLAADVKARLGGIAAAQLLSLDVQTRKLHESFGMLFSGLRIEKLLEGVSKITELFSQTSATGRALKAIVEALFQPLIDGATTGTPIVKRFFQGMVIAALYTTIGILRLRNWLRSAFGKETWKGLDTGRVALVAGASAAMVLAFALGIAAIAALVLVAPLVIAGLAIAQLISWGAALYDWWAAKDWSTLGKSILEGVVNGIRSGMSKAWDAVKSLAQGLEDKFCSVLGIHSPSRRFQTHAVGIGLGAAAGINASRGHAERAAMRLADGVDRAGATMGSGLGYRASVQEGGSSGAGAASSARGGNVMHFDSIVVHANDAAGGRAAAGAFREQLEEIFMGVNVHLGGRTAGAR